jgi:hypothetical protein
MGIRFSAGIRIVRRNVTALAAMTSPAVESATEDLDVSPLLKLLPRDIRLVSTLSNRSLPSEFTNRRIEQAALTFLKRNIKSMERNDKHSGEATEYGLMLPLNFPVDMGKGLLLPFGVKFLVFTRKNSNPPALYALRWEAIAKGRMSQLGDVSQEWGEGPYLQQGSMPQADAFIEEFLRQLLESKGKLKI